MKLIVGLGNPGEKYKHTRHNAGFMALGFALNEGDDFLTARPEKSFKSEIWTVGGGESKIIFMMPQTYMNDSGQALKVICNFYKMEVSRDLLVVHDEIDLPFGSLRLSKNSSAAGHNGVKSIIENLGTQDFFRLRIGVESRKPGDETPTENFVLQNFEAAELENLYKQTLPLAKAEIKKFIGI